MGQIQQMRGVTKVAQRSNGGYEVYLDPRFELSWLLRQLYVLAAYEERGGGRWEM